MEIDADRLRQLLLVLFQINLCLRHGHAADIDARHQRVRFKGEGLGRLGSSGVKRQRQVHSVVFHPSQHAQRSRRQRQHAQRYRQHNDQNLAALVVRMIAGVILVGILMKVITVWRKIRRMPSIIHCFFFHDSLQHDIFSEKVFFLIVLSILLQFFPKIKWQITKKSFFQNIA